MDESLLTKHEPVAPSLRFIFRLRSTLAAPITIGNTGQGTRKVIPLTGGILTTNVDNLKGESAFEGAQCIDSGADYLLKDSETTSLTRLDARYVFRLRSGREWQAAHPQGASDTDKRLHCSSADHLYIQSSGRRYVPSGDEEATRLLNKGEDIEPERYYFRLKLIFESDDPDPAIQEAVSKIVVATAVRGETSIVYDAYLLD
jgi:hypothetical protein